jgi:hypothetical protein
MNPSDRRWRSALAAATGTVAGSCCLLSESIDILLASPLEFLVHADRMVATAPESSSIVSASASASGMSKEGEEGITDNDGGYPQHLGYNLLQPAANNSGEPPPPVQPPQFLQSLLNTVAKQLSSRHLFLQGPPKSGRSSLLMDLACELAATTPCHCPVESTVDRCSCIAVALFLPLAQSSFPIHCQPATNRSTAASFSKHLLRRIQVRRIASLHDLLQQLWSIQGEPLEKQPSALLLDDLDQLVLAQPEQPQTLNDDLVSSRARESLVCKIRVKFAL